MPLAFRAKEKCLGEVLLPYLTALDCLPGQRKIRVRPQAKISLVVESFPVRSGPGPRCQGRLQGAGAGGERRALAAQHPRPG